LTNSTKKTLSVLSLLQTHKLGSCIVSTGTKKGFGTRIAKLVKIKYFICRVKLIIRQNDTRYAEF